MDLFLLSVLKSNETTSGESSSTEKLTESLRNMVNHPVFYIVIGGIVLLIIVIYFLRRFIKAKPNAVTVVIRNGKIHKLLDENNPKYFLVPFKDRVGSIISLNERELHSDELYINDGPDHLYKVNYTLKYKVTNPEKFYQFVDNFQKLMITSINDTFREFADNGNASMLVKDYRNHNGEIIKLFNKAVNQYFVEVNEFKFNLIQPLGK